MASLLMSQGIAAPPAPLGELPARPNIVLVMVDDMPAVDGRLLNYMPTTKDIFVAKGITFADFHSESPLCCPARAGFLTGQHTHNHRVTANNAALFNPSMTIATQLQGIGYTTALAGKYMNLYGKCGTANPANCAPAIPVGWDLWNAFGDPNYYNYQLFSGTGGSPATATSYGSSPADYSTDVVTARAVAQIQSAPSDEPLFQLTAYFAPHAPSTAAPRHAGVRTCKPPKWKPPNFNEADVSDKAAFIRAIALYTGSKAQGANLNSKCLGLLAVDDGVRQIRDALQATGRLDNTIFIFTGDNGMNMGEHRLSDKQAPYSTEIPFYISWPQAYGNVASRIDERIQSIDVAPTLCELAGCTMGPYPNLQISPDGISFADILRGSASTLVRDAVLDEMPRIHNARGNNYIPPWAAVTTTGASPLAATGCASAGSGGCRWHYIRYNTGATELYDISSGPCWQWTVGSPGDPCELQNLSSDAAFSEVKLELANRLAQLELEKGVPQD
jgi:arylsulfatase A-like enzyme